MREWGPLVLVLSRALLHPTLGTQRDKPTGSVSPKNKFHPGYAPVSPVVSTWGTLKNSKLTGGDKKFDCKTQTSCEGKTERVCSGATGGSNAEVCSTSTHLKHWKSHVCSLFYPVIILICCICVFRKHAEKTPKTRLNTTVVFLRVQR